MLHGFDISGYQSASWTTKTDMLFVKATENTGYTNPHFVSQFAAAKKLAAVHGAYHFARPGKSSAVAQADHFLAVVGAYLDSSTLLVLDLEVSTISQAATNQFAKDFAARLGHRYPTHRRVLYMGGGYSATNTGAGLASHFHTWWYPRYPFAYQLTGTSGIDADAWRAANRSEELSYAEIIETERAREVAEPNPVATQARTPLAALMTKWPPAFAPSAPAGRTGWSRPDIWQFTDNWGSSHLDANISDRSVAYLLGATPTEEDMDPSTSVKVGETYDKDFGKDAYPASFIWVGAFAEAKRAKAAALAGNAAIAELTKTVAALAANRDDVDVDALVARIETAIENVVIHLDIPDAPPAA